MTSFSPVRPSYLSLLFFLPLPYFLQFFLLRSLFYFFVMKIYGKSGKKARKKPFLGLLSLSLSLEGRGREKGFSHSLSSFISFQFLLLTMFRKSLHCTRFLFPIWTFLTFHFFLVLLLFLSSQTFSPSPSLSLFLLFLWPPPLLDGNNERRDKSVQGSRPSQGPNFQWEWFCGGETLKQTESLSLFHFSNDDI